METRVLSLLGLMMLASHVAGGRQYMGLIPREIRTGMLYKVDFQLFVAQKSDVQIKLSIRTSSSPISKLAWTNSEMTLTFVAGETENKRAEIMVPYSLTDGTKLHVHTSFTGMKAVDVKSATVVRPKSSIFVQTDKYIYKAGEEVRCRVLSTDEHLKPKPESITVMMKNPKGNVILQKKADPKTDMLEALVQCDFSISDDPMLGTYKVTAQTETGYTEAEFKVDEYVLPKFSVDLTVNEKYLVSSDKMTLTGTVKGTYTYGKMLKGKMHLQAGQTGKTVNDFTGSDQFSIDVSKEKDSSMLKVFVKVEEENSDKSGNSSASVMIYKSHFKAKVVQPLQYKEAKTKAYEFYVQLTNPSGGPITNWDTTLSKYTLHWKGKSDDRRTNLNGNVAVTTNPQLLTIEDPNLNYGDIEVYFTYSSGSGSKVEGISDHAKPKTYTSNGGNILNIDVSTKDETLGACVTVKDLMTASKYNPKYYYQVINNYYAQEIKPYRTVAGAKNCVNLDGMNAPKSMMVVYLVQDTSTTETEVLAASRIFDYTWKSKLQVTMSATPAIVKPGQDVSIQVQVQPPSASIVALAGIDKSANILAGGKGNDVTHAKLVEAVEQYRMFERPKENPYAHVNPLVRGGMAPGIAERRKRSAFCWRCMNDYSYTNTGVILQLAGLQIVSDATIYTTVRDDGDRDNNRGFGLGFHGGVVRGGMNGLAAAEAERDYENDYQMAYADGAPGNFYDEGMDDMMPEMDEFLPMPNMRPVQAGAIPDMIPAKAASGEADANEKQPIDPEEKEPTTQTRKEFPETWLWEILETDSNGAKQEVRKAPDSITNWMLNAFAFNAVDGLGVADTKEVTVFLEFFMSMNLPKFVVRGEEMDLSILLFNYMSKALTVNVTMEPSDDYTILDTALASQQITIAGSSSAVFQVPIAFKSIGDVILMANATGDGKSDRVERPLKVKPEGIEVVQSVSKELAVRTQDGPYTLILEDFFLEPRIVTDSIRLYLHVTGDMMGSSLKNLKGDIRMPYGCGEQNIQSLTPSVFVGRYLKAINRLEKETEDKMAKVTARGYTKELNYKHEDGSYSAFGEGGSSCWCGNAAGNAKEKKKGSTWLTAYVLKMFSLLARDEFTYVDRSVLKESYNYLKTVVTKTNVTTYFQERGHLIHKEMQGASASGVGFTAFTAIAILDYKELAVKDNDQALITDVDAMLTPASTWMMGHVDKVIASGKSYHISQLAYALAKMSTSQTDAKYIKAKELLSNFEDVITKTTVQMGCPRTGMFGRCAMPLEATDSCESDGDCTGKQMCCSIMCGQRKCMDPVALQGRGPTLVESHGYALQAYLAQWAVTTSSTEKDELRTKAETHKTWLIGQRKEGGVFSNTQDTSVAMGALSQFAIIYTDSTSIDFQIKATSNGQDISNIITKTNNNNLVLDEEKLKITGPVNNVTLDLSGTSGSAFVTVVGMYSTLSNNTKNKKTHIQIEPSVKYGEKYIHTCFELPQDTNDSGTMYTHEVETQTATKIEKMVLVTGKAMKFEVTDNKAICYHLPEKVAGYKACMDVYISEEFEIKNKQPGVVRVRDYYVPENNVEELFETKYVVVTTTDGPTTGAAGLKISFLLTTCLVLIGSLL